MRKIFLLICITTVFLSVPIQSLYQETSLRRSRVSAETFLFGALSGNFAVDEYGNIAARLSETGKRILLSPEYTQEDVVSGLNSGVLHKVSEQDIINSIVTGSRENAGLIFTGGGDCAGISQVIFSLVTNLFSLDPKKAVLGIRYAQDGFKKNQFILIDGLLAADYEGRSSTPLGSSRGDPFKDEAAFAKIAEYEFWFSTGGDDHLKVILNMAKKVPNIIAVAAPKSMDGDVAVYDSEGIHYVQSLGFNSAIKNYGKFLSHLAEKAAAQGKLIVLEAFGRKGGRVGYESVLQVEESLRAGIMTLVPEKPVTLEAAAKEALRRKALVTVVTEGLVPTDLSEEMSGLLEKGFKADWEATPAEKRLAFINEMLYRPGLYPPGSKYYIQNDFLREMFKDNNQLAFELAQMCVGIELDPNGNIAKLAGMERFVTQAVKTYARISGVQVEVESGVYLDNADREEATAMYREMIFNIAQSGASHREIHVLDVSGDEAEALVLEATSADPAVLENLDPELRRKMYDYRDRIMVLGMQNTTTLEAAAKEALRIKAENGSVVTVNIQGILPQDIKEEITGLLKSNFKEVWNAISPEGRLIFISDMLFNDKSKYYIKKEFLRNMFKDNYQLAIEFAQLCADSSDTDIPLNEPSNFVIQAIKTYGRKISEDKKTIPKVNDAGHLRYMGRGADVSELDRQMAINLGLEGAKIIGEGVPGSYIVAYLEGQDPFTEAPKRITPIRITNENNLNRYSDEELWRNGVFWIDE